MTAFPDTSFLFALYRAQDNSAAARKLYDAMREPLTISGLLAFEFRQSMRFQAWLHAQDSRKGVPAKEAEQALAGRELSLHRVLPDRVDPCAQVHAPTENVLVTDEGAQLGLRNTDGALEMATVDWVDVHRIAERLSATHTKVNGHRAIDILHLATAIHLSAKELLSFDGNQRKLATAEGLKAKP